MKMLKFQIFLTGSLGGDLYQDKIIPLSSKLESFIISTSNQIIKKNGVNSIRVYENGLLLNMLNSMKTTLLSSLIIWILFIVLSEMNTISLAIYVEQDILMSKLEMFAMSNTLTPMAFAV